MVIPRMEAAVVKYRAFLCAGLRTGQDLAENKHCESLECHIWKAPAVISACVCLQL